MPTFIACTRAAEVTRGIVKTCGWKECFLPEFDNLLVAYANRRRIMTDEDRRRVSVGGLVYPTVLINGIVAGTWKIQRDRDAVTLIIKPYRHIANTDRMAPTEEGARLLGFAAPAILTRDVVFLPAG